MPTPTNYTVKYYGIDSDVRMQYGSAVLSIECHADDRVLTCQFDPAAAGQAPCGVGNVSTTNLLGDAQVLRSPEIKHGKA